MIDNENSPLPPPPFNAYHSALDHWYERQNESIRALVSYGDFQHYNMHGAFPARSIRHTSNNTILRIIVVRIERISETYDLDPTVRRIIQDLVDAISGAAVEAAIDPDAETYIPDLQGARLAVVDGQGIEEVSMCRMTIDGSGVMPYNGWWRRNFEYGRRAVVTGRIMWEV